MKPDYWRTGVLYCCCPQRLRLWLREDTATTKTTWVISACSTHGYWNEMVTCDWKSKSNFMIFWQRSAAQDGSLRSNKWWPPAAPSRAQNTQLNKHSRRVSAIYKFSFSRAHEDRVYMERRGRKQEEKDREKRGGGEEESIVKEREAKSK